MYISFYNLGLTIIFILIIVSGGYLIAVLHQAFLLLSRIRKIIATNNNDINQCLSRGPETLANINELALSLRTTVDQISATAGLLHNDLAAARDKLRGNLETLLLYANILRRLFRVFTGKKS